MSKKYQVDEGELAFMIYKSSWLKTEVLKQHPLLQTHVTGEDASIYLLEVTIAQSNEETPSPASFLFRRNYEDEDGWRIIMFEDYSLSGKLEQRNDLLYQP